LYLCARKKFGVRFPDYPNNGFTKIYKPQFMAVKMRLQRHGRKKAPFYHIVVADARSPRDGKYIEKLGTYNPMTIPATIDIDRDSAYSWLEKGAQPTDTVRAILRFKGVMFKKHLMRGVKKGALTVEQVDEKYNAFIDVKEGKVTARAEETKASKKSFYEAVSGKPKAKKVVVVEEVKADDPEEAILDAIAEGAAEETAND
jgi:small subunit ribosomal protein S16